MPEVHEPKLPEAEMQRAFDLGKEAGIAGKPETSNPYFLTALRARWLGGWDCGASEAAWKSEPT